MFRLACRLLGNARDAEDVVQDAFVRAVTDLRRGAFEQRSSLSTWLYRITTNVALDRLRANRLREGKELPHERTSSLNPEAHVALGELAVSLAELPEDQRAALVLKELQGLSTHEAAEVLERSEGAVEQLLVRARQTLRRRFES